VGDVVVGRHRATDEQIRDPTEVLQLCGQFPDNEGRCGHVETQTFTGLDPITRPLCRFSAGGAAALRSVAPVVTLVHDTVLVTILLRRPTLSVLAATSLTYREVGATSGPLPAGYRHVTRTAQLGRGSETFDQCSAAVLSWEMHRRAGLVVHASHPVAQEGSVAALVFGASRLGLVLPCRVVYVVEEAQRRGFAYGTLPGHPEQGEESFIVVHEHDGSVVLRITAFSRPASALSRLGGPLTRWVQDWMTRRYLAAVSEAD